MPPSPDDSLDVFLSILQDDTSIQMSPPGPSIVHNVPDAVTIDCPFANTTDSSVSCILQDRSLHFRFRMNALIPCPTSSCRRSFITQQWTMTKHSVIRHLREDHDITVYDQYLWCNICKTQIIGRKVKSPPCFRTHPVMIENTTPLRFPCGKCNRSFSSQKGLHNHTIVNHPWRNPANRTPVAAKNPSSDQHRITNSSSTGTAVNRNSVSLVSVHVPSNAAPTNAIPDSLAPAVPEYPAYYAPDSAVSSPEPVSQRVTEEPPADADVAVADDNTSPEISKVANTDSPSSEFTSWFRELCTEFETEN